jgi:hypothetical protein
VSGPESNLQNKVQRFRVQGSKKAGRLGSYKAGKLES